MVVLDETTDEPSKDVDESVDESSEEIVQHGALASNEVLAAENVQDMNVPNEDALPENIDAPSVEEVVAPPPVVEEKSSEVEDKVVEPSQELKSSDVDPKVVERSLD